MKPPQAKRVIVLSLAATGALVVVGKAVDGEFPSPRIFIGLAVVYIILGFTADFAPQFAGPMAVLVFIAVLLAGGGKQLEGVAQIAVREGKKAKFRTISGGQSPTISDRVNAQDAVARRRKRRKNQ